MNFFHKAVPFFHFFENNIYIIPLKNGIVTFFYYEGNIACSIPGIIRKPTSENIVGSADFLAIFKSPC